jgi:hypothetical protein
MGTAAQKHTKSEFGIFEILGKFPKFGKIPKVWEISQSLENFPNFGNFPKVWEMIQIRIVLRTCVKCAAACPAETARRSRAHEVSCRRRTPGERVATKLSAVGALHRVSRCGSNLVKMVWYLLRMDSDPRLDRAFPARAHQPLGIDGLLQRVSNFILAR